MNSLNKLSVRVPASAILDKAGERRIHRPMIFSAALIASAQEVRVGFTAVRVGIV
jgi:hypothetical protein